MGMVRRVGKKRKRPADSGVVGWVDHFAHATKQVDEWADGIDDWLGAQERLEQQLKDVSGGVVRVSGFAPPSVADAVLEILEGLPEECWDLSEQGGDEGAAHHRFWSADVCDVPRLAVLRGIFWRMLPTYRDEPTLPIFSCARYGTSDGICRHDDRAHVPFFRDDNVYSRTVAAIWYLTRDWTEADGGCLQDLEAAETLVPAYNSLVAFDVPHWHTVTAVQSQRYRYSVFGWWHQQGRRYELHDADGSEQARTKRRKPKKK